MQAPRLTPSMVCVLVAFPALIGACAGHTRPSSGGDMERPGSAGNAGSGVIPATARLLPNGLLLTARLDQTITTAMPEGYAISTKVADTIAAKDGAVAVPAGTVIRGVVTGIRPDSGAKTPILCLNFDFLELKGRAYSIRSSVKSVRINDLPATILSRDSAATIFGNEGAGPPRGVLIALTPSATPGEPAELPAGTMLVVELDSAIAVPAR